MTSSSAEAIGYPPQFQHQFHDYVARNVTYVLALVQQSGPILADDLRVQALHTLSYAFPVSTAWIVTRELVMALAPKLEQGGQREHWLPYLQEALQQSLLHGDDAAAGECHLQLAILYRLLSQFPTAHTHLRGALEHFMALSATRDQARTLNELAWLEQVQNRYGEAVEHVAQALALLDLDDSERAMSYRVQGMIAVGLRHWPEAEQFHRMALTLFERHQDQRKVAWSLQNLAYALCQQKNYSEAITLYKQAAMTLRQLGDHHHLGIVLYNLGFTYKTWGDLAEAIAHYKQAEIIFDQLHNKWHLSRLYTDMGLDYFGQQNYVNAELAFTKSIQLFAELNDESWRLNAMDGLAMTYLRQQQPTKALAVLQDALQALAHTSEIVNYSYLYNSLQRHWQDAIEASRSLAIID